MFVQDRLRPILPKPQDSRLDRQLLAVLDRKVRRRLETDGSEPGAVVVNPHVYGQPASLNPAFRLRQVPGGVLFGHYMQSFETVWDSATTWDGKAI